jgi:predicted molibdopterin-dependent oxidoreductase YjgC
MASNDIPLRTNGDLARGAPVTITVDDRPVRAYLGENVAAALWAAGIRTLNHSAKRQEARGMYCGMGVCFGCRVTIDGVPNALACQTSVAEGMKIRLQRGHGQWER